MSKIQVSMTRKFPSGAWECFALYEGRLIRKVFYGYTRNEARALFIEEIKG